MTYLLLIALLIAALYILGRWYVEADPKDIITVGKWMAVGAVLLLFVWLILTGRLGWAFSMVPFLFVWFGRLRMALRISRWLRNFMTGKSQDAGADQDRARSPANRMTREEALAIFGLEEDANEAEIKAAYNRLISQVHPDKGGSDYLAAQINEAKDVLLNG